MQGVMAMQDGMARTWEGIDTVDGVQIATSGDCVLAGVGRCAVCHVHVSGVLQHRQIPVD